MVDINERKYIAISIKHSMYSRSGLWFWGKRTKDEEKRCFSGYSNFLNPNGMKCELYSLKEFQDHYGHGVVKCDEPVDMKDDLVKRWKEWDTVLVSEADYKNFIGYQGD